MQGDIAALLPLLALMAAAGLLAAAALHDIVARTIPDTVSLLLAALGLALRAAAGDLLPGLLAAGIVFGLAFLAWRRGMMGGGDVKLLGAVALLVPPAQVPGMVLAVAMAGGLVGLAFLALRPLARRTGTGTRPGGLLPRVLRAEAWRIRRGGPLPYAVAIAGGVLFTLARINPPV